mgnify:CR=1 FL=1
MKKGLSNSFRQPLSLLFGFTATRRYSSCACPGNRGPSRPWRGVPFDDVAHAAVPARELRNVARGFDHLGCRIRGTDGDSDCLHTLQVRDVVAHVDDVRRIESVACEEILHGRYFVHAVQVNICDSQHFEPVVERCAPSARDDAHFVAHTERIGDGIAVLGIVFSDEIPIDQGHDSPVGHYAVHVENERFGLYDVFFEVSHIS